MRLIDADALETRIRAEARKRNPQEPWAEYGWVCQNIFFMPTAQVETNHDDVLSAIDMLDSYRNQDEISYNAYSELADAIYGLEVAQPTAQERPVGHWLWDEGYGVYHCPECDYIPDQENIDNNVFKYCPSCGADMRGAAE